MRSLHPAQPKCHLFSLCEPVGARIIDNSEMADDKLTLFPKRTLRALCTVRILLASVTLVWLVS